MADAVADQAARNGAMVVCRANAEDLTVVLPPLVEMVPDAVIALPGVDVDHLVAQLAERQDAWLLAGPAEAITLGGATNDDCNSCFRCCPPIRGQYRRSRSQA